MLPATLLIVLAGCGSNDDPARYAEQQARPTGSQVRSLGPDPASVPQRANVEELVHSLIGLERKPYLVVQRLEKSRPLLTPDETAIVDRIVARIHPNGEVDELEEVLRDLARLAPDDFGAQAAVASVLQGFSEPRAGELETPAELVQAVEDARALVERFPGEARAHGILGNALVASRADIVEAFTELKTCVDLDRSQDECRERYNGLAEFHTAKRCEPKAMVRSLALYQADVGTGPTYKLAWEDRKLRLRKPALITRKGFRQARAEPEGVSLELSDDAVEILAPLYEQDWAAFALVAGDRVLLAGNFAHTDGPLRSLLLPADASLDLVCRTSDSALMPDGLPSRID